MLGKGVSQLWSKKPKMWKVGSHIGDREAFRSHREVMHSHLIDRWWTGARSKKIDGGSVQIQWDQQRRSGINRGIDPRQRSLRRSIRDLQISGGHLGGWLVFWCTEVRCQCSERCRKGNTGSLDELSSGKGQERVLLPISAPRRGYKHWKICGYHLQVDEQDMYAGFITI